MSVSLGLRCLVEQGVSPRQALKDVRAVRPEALETDAWIDYLLAQ